MSDDAWTTVSRKTKGNRTRRVIGAKAETALQAAAAATNYGDEDRAAESSLSEEELHTRASACAAKVERAMTDVRNARFVDAVLERVERAVAERRRGRRVVVLVLGLGSPNASAAARCQLALAKLMGDAIDRACGEDDDVVKIKLRDPCFTLVDERFLGSVFGCETLTEEACDAYLDGSASEFVLFYMPHCEGHLYESVVRARWTVDAMRDFVCVGNTFTTYAERWSVKNADPEKKKPTRVIAASAVCESSLVDPGDTFDVPGAFNDTSVQCFNVKDALPNVDED